MVDDRGGDELLPADADPFATAMGPDRDEPGPPPGDDRATRPDGPDDPSWLASVGLGPGPRALRVRFTAGSIARAVLLLVVYVIVLQVAVAAATPLVWFAEGVVGAALLFPVTAVLDRHMPRGLAVALVSVGLVAVVALVGARIFVELRNEADQFAQQAPQIGSDLEANPTIGEAAQQFGAAEKITNIADSARGALNFEGASVSTLSTAASFGSAAFVVWLFGVMMLFSARRFLEGGIGMVRSEDRRQRLARIGAVGYANAWRYLASMSARSVVYGLVTFVVASALGLRAPTLVAVWVLAWSLVPAVGLFLGWSLVAFVGLFVSVPVAVGLFLAGIALQLLDIYLVQRRIEQRTVHMGPALVLLGSIIGFALYGLGGVILTVSALTFVVAVLDEIRPHPAAAPGVPGP